MAVTSVQTTGDPSVHQYSVLAADLEKQELESAGGVATPQLYGQLLAIYLLQGDLPNAKFLWKRIPSNVKESNPELGKIWAVGQKFWNREITGFYTLLEEDWPEHVKPIMSAIGDVTRNRALQLISKAYSSVSLVNVAACVGLTPERSVEVITSLGWSVDTVTKIVTPKVQEGRPEDCTPSEEQLSKLTEFVAFLEN